MRRSYGINNGYGKTNVENLNGYSDFSLIQMGLSSYLLHCRVPRQGYCTGQDMACQMSVA
jgi:hypothetical protein